MVSSPPYVCGSVGLSPLSFSVYGSILLGINRIGPFDCVHLSLILLVNNNYANT